MEALDELMRWKAYMVEEGYTSKDDDTIEILRDYITTTEAALAEKDAALRDARSTATSFKLNLDFYGDDDVCNLQNNMFKVVNIIDKVLPGDAQVEKAIGGGE
jgi:hypothetical protein